jgi:hypothetical protein
MPQFVIDFIKCINHIVNRDVIGIGEAERAKHSLYLENNLLLRLMCYGIYILLKYSMAQNKLARKLAVTFFFGSTHEEEVRVFT